MKLGRVIGTVVATTKAPGLEGVRLLIVQPLARDLSDGGRPVVAADGVAMAGHGEMVTQPGDLGPALKRAEASGLPSLVDFHIAETMRMSSNYSQ